jgi:hypothetical protein
MAMEMAWLTSLHGSLHGSTWLYMALYMASLAWLTSLQPAGGLRPSSIPLNTPRRTPLAISVALMRFGVST